MFIHKKTAFYNEIVETVYICKDMPNTVWFKAKNPYGKRNEITLWNELEHIDIEVMER